MNDQVAAPTEGGDDAESYEAARYSRADRIAAINARLENHGTGVHDAMRDTARANVTAPTLRYDTYTKEFSVNSGVDGKFSETEMETLVNEGEVAHIPDDGRVTSAERARLLGVLAELKGRLDKHDGFDNSGAPRYQLTGDERARLTKYHDGISLQTYYALAELDALDAQRDRGKQIKNAMDAADAAREDRIDAYHAEAIERLEGEERARRTLAARKKLDL